MSDGKMWEIEDGFFSGGVGTICGVDEAGRGPLAGPVYAAAVILPPHLDIPGLTDSKKLTDKSAGSCSQSFRSRRSPTGSDSPRRRKLTKSTFYRPRFLPWSGRWGSLP